MTVKGVSKQFSSDAAALIHCIRDIYGNGFVALHEPRFNELDINAVANVVRSGFVSSVGEEVKAFETELATYTGARHVIAVVNGTAALHAALLGCGVTPGDEVLTQSLTFVATCNAIHYCGAQPVFIDVDPDTLGLCPVTLKAWLETHARVEQGRCINKQTGRNISACVPMHTFGLPAKLAELLAVCEEFAIPVIEDAAEGLGSYYNGRHVGRFGRCATLSFNGNKIITTGGGGAVMTDDAELANQVRHLTTTAKVAASLASFHDEVGYNYRMPNLNAGLGLAQMQHLPDFIVEKKQVARTYAAFFANHAWDWIAPIPQADANFWLNAVMLPSVVERDAFIALCAKENIQVRPVWVPMHHLPMFEHCQKSSLVETEKFAQRVVNLPSSANAFPVNNKVDE